MTCTNASGVSSGIAHLNAGGDRDAQHADLLGDLDVVRAKNRAAIMDEQIRAWEILRANRVPPPDTSWATTVPIRPRGSRFGRWVRGILRR